MIDDFFGKAHELVQQGMPFVTATVVRAERPSSGKPGDRAIITAEGVMHGWIGGSCAQPTVIKESLRALAADETRLIRLSTEPEGQEAREGLVDLPMTCFSGGTLEIYLEPQQPRPRLLIVGTLPVARALARLGAAMNYHIILVDLDGSGEAIPDADEVLTSLDGIGQRLRPFTYVVVATHGNYDEPALEKILSARPGYVGLVASPKRAAAVRDYLTAQGLSNEELLPLKAPAGLDIQARRGDEIALSIMAEIVQKRRNAEMMNLALLGSRETGLFQEDDVALSGEKSPVSGIVGLESIEVEAAETAVTAIDPICGMAVDIATARHIFDYEGQTYYFCCPGCQSRFAREPETYLAAAS